MFQDETIICFGSRQWDINHMVSQNHIMSHLSHDNDVLYIESLGARTIRLDDFKRILRRLKHAILSPPAPGEAGFQAKNRDSGVLSALVIPYHKNFWINRFNQWALLRQIDSAMKDWNRRHPIVWTYQVNPTIAKIARSLQPKLWIHHSVDQIFLHRNIPDPEWLRRTEAQMLSQADIILVSAYGLKAEKEPYNSNILHVPNSVDTELFAFSGDGIYPPPPRLQNMPRPIIGFVGALDFWVNLPLLNQIAEAFPHGSVVQVGSAPSVKSRPELKPNLHLIGPIPHRELPTHIAAMDVCLIPYLLTPFTQFTFPSKLMEYLAVGRPVVSTPLPEVVRYEGVVAIGRTHEDFVARVKEAVESDTPEFRRRRREVAQVHSWPAQLERIWQHCRPLMRDNG